MESRTSGFDPEKLSLNSDDIQFIDTRDRIYFDSVYTAVNDLKANSKDWIKEAVADGFKIHDEKYCNEHIKQTAKNTKHIKWLTWWDVALTIAILTIIGILIWS